MHIANTKLLIIVTLELWTIAESQQFFHQVCYSLNWKKGHKMFLMLVRIIRTFYQNLKIQHKIIWKKKFSSLFFHSDYRLLSESNELLCLSKVIYQPLDYFWPFYVDISFPPIFLTIRKYVFLVHLYNNRKSLLRITYVKWICTKVFTIIHKFSICLYYGRKPQLQFVCHKVSNFIRSMFSSKIWKYEKILFVILFSASR